MDYAKAREELTRKVADEVLDAEMKRCEEFSYLHFYNGEENMVIQYAGKGRALMAGIGILLRNIAKDGDIPLEELMDDLKDAVLSSETKYERYQEALDMLKDAPEQTLEYLLKKLKDEINDIKDE